MAANIINDGGPAFPVLESNGEGRLFLCSAGMSLRDYFIANAPAEPQPWFAPEMPPQPRPRMEKPDDLTKEEREELAGWWDCLSAKDMNQPRARVIAEDWERNKREHRAWQSEWEKQRYIQWPAAWADAMLEQRAKGGGAA